MQLSVKLRFGVVLFGALVGPACNGGSAPAAKRPEASTDASPPVDAGDELAPESSTDAGIATWPLYTISPGAHIATLTKAAAGNPIDGPAGGVVGRDFQLALDPSAEYVITQPVQPNDQFDWNKLPGLSDCNQFDLSIDGAMFGWRWRTDLSPQVLEITAYANDTSTHLTPSAPLITLDADDLASVTPLRYRVWIDGDHYAFSIAGTMRGRDIAASTTLPRACPSTDPATLGVQWAGGFYFGGTSTAPSTITARVFEIPFN